MSIRSAILALVLVLVPQILFAQSLEQQVISQSFNLMLDENFTSITSENMPNAQGPNFNSVVMQGALDGTALYLSVGEIQVKNADQKTLDPQLVQLVKDSYQAFAGEMKKNTPKVTSTITKIKPITLGGAPAQELRFNTQFGDHQASGIVIASYREPYINMILGTATGEQKKVNHSAFKVLEKAIDTIALETDSRFQNGYRDNNYFLPLPKDITLITTQHAKASSGHAFESVDLQGSNALVKSNINISSFELNYENPKDRFEKMSASMKNRLNYFLGQYQKLHPHAKVTQYQIESFTLSGKNAQRMAFTIMNNGRKTEGAVMMVDAGKKSHLIFANVQAFGKRFDESAVDQIKDSLTKMRF